MSSFQSVSQRLSKRRLSGSFAGKSNGDNWSAKRPFDAVAIHHISASMGGVWGR
jgi:hypothetical protein